MEEDPSAQKALIVISKLPRYSKTRVELPAETREAFYSLCIRSTIHKCRHLSRTHLVVSYFPSSDLGEMKRICGDNVEVFSADKADFGEALIESYMHCFRSGYCAVGNIAPDSPDTPLSHLSMGLDLASDDVVIGPTVDGGYYFLSMRSASTLAIFRDVDWGTERVFGQLIFNMQSCNLKVRVLPMWYDIDSIRDVYVLRNHLCGLRAAGQLEPYLVELKTFLCKSLSK